MLMGNCKWCYYNERDDYEQVDGSRLGYCHRFPHSERVDDMHSCGEFWNRETAARQSHEAKYRSNL